MNLIIFDENIKNKIFYKKIYKKVSNYNCINTHIYNNNDSILSFVNTCNDLRANIFIINITLINKSIIDFLKELRYRDKYLGELIILIDSYNLIDKLLEIKIEALNFILNNEYANKEIIDSINFSIDLIKKKNKIKECTYIRVKNNYCIERININDIYYIESIKNSKKISIYLKDDKIQLRNTLTSIKKDLNLNFIQIHKSLIINKNVIKKIFKEHNNYYALLINNEILPVSRLRFKEICKII